MLVFCYNFYIMKLYFARHGDTDANQNSPIDPATGDINEPLNQNGINQAHGLAEKLKDVHFDEIISSPMTRAYQTAQIAGTYQDGAVQIEPFWRERQIGRYTDPETWNKLYDFDQEFSFGNSESLKDFFERVYDALDNLKRHYPDKTVLVVSHIGVALALEAYVKNLPFKGSMVRNLMKNGEYRLYEL